MTIRTEFDFGDVVYLKTDRDQLQRLVTGVTVYPEASIEYQLTCGESSTWHYGFEISDKQDVVLKTNS